MNSLLQLHKPNHKNAHLDALREVQLRTNVSQPVSITTFKANLILDLPNPTVGITDPNATRNSSAFIFPKRTAKNSSHSIL
jgi:hypothetical protein